MDPSEHSSSTMLVRTGSERAWYVWVSRAFAVEEYGLGVVMSLLRFGAIVSILFFSSRYYVLHRRTATLVAPAFP